MKRDSQQSQFNHYCGLFIISLYFACRDLNVRLKLCAVIKFRAKLKTARLAIFSLMSRHKIVCRDLSKLWKDKLFSGCDIMYFMQCSIVATTPFFLRNCSCRDINVLS